MGTAPTDKSGVGAISAHPLLPGVCERNRSGLRLFLLPELRLGTMRLKTQNDLFPSVHPPDNPVLDERLRGATFVEHQVRSIINSPDSTGMGFWSINPYVGCEFGCTYCYARHAHRYVVDRAVGAGRLSATQTHDFERDIFVKRRSMVTRALQRDLIQVVHRHRVDRAYPIVIGTATDPYQPAEKQFGITKQILEHLLQERGLTIGIITKSPMICHDIDILKSLQQRHRVSIYISLISTDPEIIRRFETRSPMPHTRLRALRRLTEAGLHAGFIVAPILPGITDTVSEIRAIARALREAGGHFAHPSPLRMYPALHQNFLPVIKQHYPELYARYRRAYRGAGAAPRHYTEALIRRFKRIAIAEDIPVTDPVIDRRPIAVSGQDDRQLALWT